MRAIDDGERRARLALRQRLAPQEHGSDVAALAGEIAGLHASDPATVMLAARARLRDATPEAIEHALCVERSLVRMLGMRRTMFVVPVALAAVVQASCTDALVPVERARLVKHLEAGGVTGDGERWLQATQEQTLSALVARGEATAAELRSGGRGGSWAAGRSARTARSSSRCSRTSAPRRPTRSPPRHGASATGSAPFASRRAFARRWSARSSQRELTPRPPAAV